MPGIHVQLFLYSDAFPLIECWTNPRSGSRVSRRRRAHDNQCAGCHRVNWIIYRSRPIMAKVCAKKLSGESAKREGPDTAAPTHSTASRGLFAKWGESS